MRQLTQIALNDWELAVLAICDYRGARLSARVCGRETMRSP